MQIAIGEAIDYFKTWVSNRLSWLDTAMQSLCYVNGVTSSQFGNWNNATTWSCSYVPMATDPAIIGMNQMGSVDTTVWAKKLVLTGSLQLRPTGTLKVGQ